MTPTSTRFLVKNQGHIATLATCMGQVNISTATQHMYHSAPRGQEMAIKQRLAPACPG